jgi:predicted metalloprotease with PDZ domain
MAVCATLGVLLFAGTGTGAVQALEPIQYTLRLPAPATHYIDVEARLPTSRKPAVELMMAVWTPGSYLVREFARHVEEVRASDASGHALTLEKTRKNRWRVQTEFRSVAREVAGADLGDFFHRALETTQELDYAEMLDWYGLRFAQMPDQPSVKAWLGALTRADGGRLVVSSVLRDSPGYVAGVSAGDELLAIDDFRLGTDGLDAVLRRYAPGDKVTVLISRRDQLSRLEITLGNAPPDQWMLTVGPDATPVQTERLEAWLGR